MEKENRVRRLRNATAIQWALTAGGWGLYFLTGNPAFRAGANHDSGDTLHYGIKYQTEKRNWNQHSLWFKTVLRCSMGIISLGAIHSAYENAEAIIDGDDPADSTEDTLLLAAGAVAYAYGNTRTYEQMRKINVHSPASQSGFDHARIDHVASKGFAASLVLEAVGIPGASLWGGYGFAAYTAIEAGGHIMDDHSNHA